MCTKRFKEFFKKWEKEVWFFEMMGVISLVLVVLLLKVWITEELFLYAFVDLILAVIGGVISFIMVVLISVPLYNLGAVIVSLIKNSPSEHDYPIKLTDLEKEDVFGWICCCVTIAVIVTIFILSPTKFL